MCYWGTDDEFDRDCSDGVENDVGGGNESGDNGSV